MSGSAEDNLLAVIGVVIRHCLVSRVSVDQNIVLDALDYIVNKRRMEDDVIDIGTFDNFDIVSYIGQVRLSNSIDFIDQ